MKAFAIAVGACVLILLLTIGMTAFGLKMDRWVQPYQKETERLTYENSVAHQQGANSGIAIDCANMQSNTGAQRLAFARFALTDAASYSGDRGLSADARQCVADAKSILAAQ